VCVVVVGFVRTVAEVALVKTFALVELGVVIGLVAFVKVVVCVGEPAQEVVLAATFVVAEVEAEVAGVWPVAIFFVV
jgi:hypothetical protein